MRKKKLAWNTSSSLVYQIILVICGLILPQLILESFGSEVNGLVNSITQFLHVIALLECGVGAVMQSALYKPLVEQENLEISKIITSGNKFFRKLALILCAYVLLLVVVYPFFINIQFDFWYTAFLIIIIGISTFAENYFGIVDRILLTADQRGYIKFIVQIITIIISTLLCVILIKCQCSIHVVKCASTAIYLVRPVIYRIYVNKFYSIDRHAYYDEEPIRQKWNGFAQHIAFYVLENTDIIILTTFASLTDVSIYHVYYLVINGVKQLFTSLTGGVQSVFGELWAKQEEKTLFDFFSNVEWCIHNGVTMIFGCTSCLIIPFVLVYTKDVKDANYNVPLFALLIVLANAIHCLRMPYNMMILAAGHYKETQSCYIIAAVLNVVISVIAVINWGIIGVALGTLIAMLYQTLWMAYYNSKNFIHWPFRKFIKQMLVDVIIFVCGTYASSYFSLKKLDYYAWILLAIKTALVWIVVAFVISCIFYYEKLKVILKLKIKK